MMSGYNLPPGCTTNDIDRAAGAFDEEPETEREHHWCEHHLCDEPRETFCDECDTPFCSDHGTKGGDREGGSNVHGQCHGAYAVPSVCWKCGGFNADEEVN